MIYVFDLDGTLCSNSDGRYEQAAPYRQRIQYVNELYEDGNTIIIDTARGSTTGINWRKETKRQLASWGVKYHKLRVGKKITADRYIDDKGIKAAHFFKRI